MKALRKVTIVLVLTLAFLSLTSFSSHIYSSFPNAAAAQQLQKSYSWLILEGVHAQEVTPDPPGAARRNRANQVELLYGDSGDVYMGGGQKTVKRLLQRRRVLRVLSR